MPSKWSVCVRYTLGRRLVGDTTANSRLINVQIIESQFADDVALYDTSREDFEKSFVQTTRDCMGLDQGRKLSPTKGCTSGEVGGRGV